MALALRIPAFRGFLLPALLRLESRVRPCRSLSQSATRPETFTVQDEDDFKARVAESSKVRVRRRADNKLHRLGLLGTAVGSL